MKRRTLMASTLAALLVSGAAWAEDKVLAIVVKGLDNPFFEQINKGCQKWNGENAGSGYTCFYTGPASSAAPGRGGDRDFAVERAPDGQDAARAGAEDPDHDHRR
jgi:ABC-type sugar transport system substrate-binding protein